MKIAFSSAWCIIYIVNNHQVDYFSLEKFYNSSLEMIEVMMVVFKNFWKSRCTYGSYTYRSTQQFQDC